MDGVPANLRSLLCVVLIGGAWGCVTTTETLFMEGNASYQRGDYAAAIYAFTRVLQSDPDRDLARFLRGRAWQELGVEEHAIEDFSLLMEKKPVTPEVYLSCAMARLDLLDRIQGESGVDSSLGLVAGGGVRELQRFLALNDVNRAVVASSQSAVAFRNRGAVYLRLGMYADALADLGRAAKILYQDPWTFVLRGRTHAALGNHSDAEADFTIALLLSPFDVEALYNRGVSLSSLGRHRDAIVDFSGVLMLDRNDGKAWLGRGRAWKRLGRLTEACTDLCAAIALGVEEARQDLKADSCACP